MTASPLGPSGGNADPLLGQVLLGRYEIVGRAETSATTRLYEARRNESAEPVDVEVIDASRASAADVDRFLEDARTVARVGHENVVAIFNGGRTPQGDPFLAREHLQGIRLSRVLAADGPLLWDRVQGIVQQVAAALAAAHRHGVLHGNLSLDTTLLEPREGRRDFVKVLGFGRARLGGEAPGDSRGDVRALGALTYALVTGNPPAGGAAPAAPTTVRPPGSLPAELDGVLLRALDAEPENRWPDVTSFADALARCRLTRRQSVRVEALAAAERSGKTGAFEADARRRRLVRALASVAAGVALAIVVLRVLATSPGHVHISTVPSDADVTFNGVLVPARSPLVLDAAPGRYAVKVARAGYVTVERAIDVPARATVAVPVTLTALPAPPPAAVNPAAAATEAAPPAAPGSP
ncbi:MAG TPA: PEGA domain-containing protein [Polyangia bacterium]|nr:PEGA domain-containing protein [Polyangia bacterium]